MSPSAANITLGRQTSCLRMSGGREVAVGTDVEGTVFAIVACTRVLKAFGESRSGATSNGDVEETSGVENPGISYSISIPDTRF